MRNRVEIENKNTSIFKILLNIIFICGSFDVILNGKVAGFSTRFVYLPILLIIMYYSFQIIVYKKIRLKFLAIYPFIIWYFIIWCFIFNTPLIGRNIGYLLWLTIHIFFIISLNHIASYDKMYSIIKTYLTSFYLICIFGIIQFLLGIVGIDLFVVQWWIPNRLPRINGLSYEPSYYCTYLIIGFSMSYYLFKKKVKEYGKMPRNIVILSIVTIVLSSSRMGILVVLLQILIFEVRERKKEMKKLLIFLYVFLTIIGGAIWIVLNTSSLAFLLNGLGVSGSSAHSVLERLDGFTTQIDIVRKEPFKGYSLGGVSQAIAFEKGVSTITQDEIKPYDISMNVFMEALTASGVVGFIFFMAYLFLLIKKPYKLSNSVYIEANDKLLLKSLIWSFLFELLILCFNQNILRVYLWTHIAVLNLAFFCIKQKSVNS